MNARVYRRENYESVIRTFYASNSHVNNHKNDPQLENILIPMKKNEDVLTQDLHPFLYAFLVFLSLSVFLSLFRVAYYQLKSMFANTTQTVDNGLSTDRESASVSNFVPVVSNLELQDSLQDFNCVGASDLAEQVTIPLCSSVDTSMSTCLNVDTSIPLSSYADISLSSMVNILLSTFSNDSVERSNVSTSQLLS